MRLKDIVKAHILVTYEMCRQDKGLTAKTLGVSKAKVYRHLHDYGIIVTKCKSFQLKRRA